VQQSPGAIVNRHVAVKEPRAVVSPLRRCDCVGTKQQRRDLELKLLTDTYKSHEYRAELRHDALRVPAVSSSPRAERALLFDRIVRFDGDT
jgi:hypothetical protein